MATEGVHRIYRMCALAALGYGLCTRTVHVSRYMLVHGLVWSTCSYIHMHSTGQARRDDTQALAKVGGEKRTAGQDAH